DAAAGKQQSLYALGHEAAVGDVVAAVISADGREQGLAAGGVVDVDGVTDLGDPVVELPAVEAVLSRQLILADHPPRLADADERRGGGDERVLEAGDVTPQEVHKREHLPFALDLAA